MLYLATASGPEAQAAIASGELGQMLQPKAANRLVPGATWAMDNGMVKLIDGRPQPDPSWESARWLRYLDRMADQPGCLFAVVPDHVGDAARTTELWHQWAGEVRDRGYRPAYVLQNGCTGVPADAGAVFTGGDDTWKLGADAQALVADARARGLWCHMGRVNTLNRLRKAHADGYHSVDGTLLAYGAAKNLPILRRFLALVHHPQLAL